MVQSYEIWVSMRKSEPIKNDFLGESEQTLFLGENGDLTYNIDEAERCRTQKEMASSLEDYCRRGKTSELYPDIGSVDDYEVKKIVVTFYWEK